MTATYRKHNGTKLTFAFEDNIFKFGFYRVIVLGKKV